MATKKAKAKPVRAKAKRAASAAPQTRSKSQAIKPRRPVTVEVLRVPKSGKWILKEKGEDQARASFDQKEDAIGAAKLLAKAENATLKIPGGATAAKHQKRKSR